MSILLLIFFINVMAGPLFAIDEVNKLSSKPPLQLGSYMQPSLPRLNINYDALASNTNRSEYSQPLQNFVQESSIYCPHTEILSRILNELRYVLPQDSSKVKDILSNYQVILQNALNSRNSVESLNKLRSDNYFNYIDSLAKKLILMDDQNVKTKISFEYEIPTIPKKICEKLCNDLLYFANARNSAPINNLNYAQERGKIKQNAMTFLQNYRPDNIYFNSPSYINLRNQFPTISNPDYENLPTNVMTPISKPSQPLLDQTRSTISNSLKNVAYQTTSPKGTVDSAMYSKQHPWQESIVYPYQYYNLMPKGPLLPNLKSTGNIKTLQNAAPALQNPAGTEESFPVRNVPSHLQKLTENAGEIEEFVKKFDDKYRSNENSQYHHKTQIQQLKYNTDNAMQYLGKHIPTIVTPTKSYDPALSMLPNSWSHPNYIPTSNRFKNNEKLLQEKLIHLYRLNNPLASNLILETTTLHPANWYQNLDTNDLSNMKQYESAKLETDSLLAQANSLDRYNQHLQSSKNLLYQQTNPESGYLLNRQIPYSLLKLIPISYENNNALYNSYTRNINQLGTQSFLPNKPFLYPNLYYYNNNLGITNSAKSTQENSDQFQDLHRLLAVSNLDKLNYVSNTNGIVELTYKLNHSRPLVEPFYYVKYRLPFNLFLLNLKKILTETPSLRNHPQEIHKDLLVGSKITASSSELKSLNTAELLKIISTNGTLVTAKVFDSNDTTANEQIKIVQKLNANMPLEDIVRTNANITRVADLTSNIPTINYSLNDLQRKIAVNRFFLNPYNAQANLNYYPNIQNPNFLTNKLPMMGNKHLQIKKNYPYS